MTLNTRPAGSLGIALPTTQQVKQLTAANARLLGHIHRKSDTAKREQRRVQSLKQIEAMIKAGASQEEFSEAIHHYKDLVRAPTLKHLSS